MHQETAPPPQTGLILAAGLGARLAVGAVQIKPLRPVGGRPLVFRAIEQLEHAGCMDVVLVTGFEAELLRDRIVAGYDGKAELRFVHNPDYRLQNGVSVLAARAHVDGTFLLAMADHVVERSMMELAGRHRPPIGGATLLVDFKIDQVFDLDDATKVRADGERIVAIGKTISDYNCIDTGIFVCTDGLMDAIAEHYRANGDASLSNGVQALARAGRMTVLDVGDKKWMDVDTPAMLADAEKVLRDRGTRW